MPHSAAFHLGFHCLQNWGKDLTSKLGEINDIEHNKGSKIYPQNQVILNCIMPTDTTLAQVFKYHSDMGHCSH